MIRDHSIRTEKGTRWQTTASGALLAATCALLLSACSAPEASETDAFTRELARAAEPMVVGRDAMASQRLPADPGICASTPLPAAPAPREQAQADLLVQHAREAELAGDALSVRELLSRAAGLDGLSEGVAYRLARASEQTGDTSTAVREYCRYLSLAPSAANAPRVRERIASLTRPSGARAAASTPTPVLRRRVTPRAGGSAATAPPAGVASAIPAPASPRTTVSAGNTGADPATGGSSSGSVERTAPAPPEPGTGRLPVREIAIGAAIGAAAGAVIGRDAKGALIGAAAGGILGGVVGNARDSRRVPDQASRKATRWGGGI